MTINRRIFTAGAAALAFGGASAAPIAGGRPIRIVVGFPPGGGLDILTRIVAQNMGNLLAQPVVVDNRPGGDGIIAADFVAKAAPDGLTLYIGSGTSMIATPLLKAGAIPYDPFKDFTPITQMGLFTLIWLVAPELPVNSLAEFVTYVRARPGQLNYASSNNTTRLAAMQVLSQYKLDMAHIPYKGDAAAQVDLMANRVHMMVATVASASALIKDGKLKALMLQRGSRTSVLPDVPTVKETGANVRISPWSGIFGPANMDPATVQQINQAYRAAVADKASRDQFDQKGFEATPTTPQEMAANLRSEYEVFRKAIQEDGVKFD